MSDTGQTLNARLEALPWQWKVGAILVAGAIIVPAGLYYGLVLHPTWRAGDAVHDAFGDEADFHTLKVFNSLYQFPDTASHLGRHKLICGTAQIDGEATVVAVLFDSGRRNRLYSPEIYTPGRTHGERYPGAGEVVMETCEAIARGQPAGVP